MKLIGNFGHIQRNVLLLVFLWFIDMEVSIQRFWKFAVQTFMDYHIKHILFFFRSIIKYPSYSNQLFVRMIYYTLRLKEIVKNISSGVCKKRNSCIGHNIALWMHREGATLKPNITYNKIYCETPWMYAYV